MTSVGTERAGVSAIDYSYFCVFFLFFFWVLVKGCVALLWYFLDLPYN